LDYSLDFTTGESFFKHIMIKQEHDTSNWIMEDSGHFTLKSARKNFLDPGVPCGWGKIIWSQYIPPSKNSSTLESFSWETSYRSTHSTH